MTELRKSAPDEVRPQAAWLSQRERGTVAAIRIATLWATLLGRKLSRPLVYLIAAYYSLFDGRTKRLSRAWLTRVHGEAPKFRSVFRHIMTFVQVTLDRIYFITGRVTSFEVTSSGQDHLAKQVASGQGAILLGAHLGSFEAMRASGQEEHLPLSIVGTWENARMINALLSSLDPGMSAQVVHAGGDPVSLALTLRERIESGGMLAMMADRAGPNEKTVEVDFLGDKASFATGPFLLAAVLKCPVYLVFGLYFEPNRYELFCEPFSERIVLPRGNRQAGLEEAIVRYSARLESYARRAPNNWFNFFDFWEKPDR